MNKAGRPAGIWQKRVAYSALLFIGYVGAYALPVQIGAVTDGLGFSLTQSGLLGTLELGFMALATMVAAPIVARLPQASRVFPGAILLALLQWMSCFCTSFWGLAILRSLVGLLCGLMYSYACMRIGREKEPDRSYALGMVGASGGFILLLYILPIAAGYRQQMSVYFVIGLFVLAAAFLLKGLNGPDFESRDASDAANIAVDEDLPVPDGRSKQAATVLLLAAAGLSQLALGGVWAFAERVGASVVVSEYILGLIFSASVVAMAMGSFGAALLSLRVGRALPLAGGMFACALSCFAITFSVNALSFAFALFLYGAAFLFTVSYVIGWAGALDPTGRLAAFTAGFILFFYSLGGYAGGLLVSGWSLRAPGMAAGCICLLSIPLLLAAAGAEKKVCGISMAGENR